MSNQIKLIPISEATTPKTGKEVYVNYWWVIKEESVIGYASWGDFGCSDGSPQANADENIAKMIGKKCYKTDDVRQIPLVYWSKA